MKIKLIILAIAVSMVFCGTASSAAILTIGAGETYVVLSGEILDGVTVYIESGEVSSLNPAVN